eukprot:2067027-Amphidinium_carterae.1
MDLHSDVSMVGLACAEMCSNNVVLDDSNKINGSRTRLAFCYLSMCGEACSHLNSMPAYGASKHAETEIR